ncbi:MAG: lactonase family protein [Candidatus Latescibacteria bacterium]|nr:lactonase family protein [Candidatus Latescibacterota bacterium]
MATYLYLALNGESKLASYTLNPDTGKLAHHEDVQLTGAPGPLAADPTGRFLYAGLRSTRQLASFAIDQSGGRLKHLGSVPLLSDPCCLSVDHRGRFLLSAYYSAGATSVHRLDTQGAAVEQPVMWLSTAPCAHSIFTDPSNRYAFLPHVAQTNAIYQFLFDEETGYLTPNPLFKVAPPPDTGPRHYVYHPTLPVVYFDNEQASSVTAYHLDTAQGTLSAFQTLPTLPADFSGENTCAQIRIHPEGKFLYAANRGHHSIACYAIDTHSGQLTSLGQQPTEQTPRDFNLDPRGRYLYAAGQASGRLAVYRIDPASGRLAPIETYEVGKAPMWVLPLELG